MTSCHYLLECTTRSELKRVVEPLASFICAAEQPRSALRSALSELFREVANTNRAAATHAHTHYEEG